MVRTALQPGPATGHYHLGLGVEGTEPESAAEIAATVAAHQSDSTAVHGITDTSALLDTPAAWVDPESVTFADDLITSLVAAGLMEEEPAP